MAIPLYSNSDVEYFNQAIKQCCHKSPHSLYSLQPCFTMLPSHVIVVNSLTSTQNFDLLHEILALISTDVSVMPPPALAPLQDIQKIIFDDFELRNYPSQSDMSRSHQTTTTHEKQRAQQCHRRRSKRTRRKRAVPKLTVKIPLHVYLVKIKKLFYTIKA